MTDTLSETSKFDKAHGELQPSIRRALDHDNDGDLDIIDSMRILIDSFKKPRFTYKIFENDGTGKFNSIPKSLDACCYFKIG